MIFAVWGVAAHGGRVADGGAEMGGGGDIGGGGGGELPWEGGGGGGELPWEGAWVLVEVTTLPAVFILVSCHIFLNILTQKNLILIFQNILATLALVFFSALTWTPAQSLPV